MLDVQAHTREGKVAGVTVYYEGDGILLRIQDPLMLCGRVPWGTWEIYRGRGTWEPYTRLDTDPLLRTLRVPREQAENLAREFFGEGE